MFTTPKFTSINRNVRPSRPNQIKKEVVVLALFFGWIEITHTSCCSRPQGFTCSLLCSINCNLRAVDGANPVSTGTVFLSSLIHHQLVSFSEAPLDHETTQIKNTEGSVPLIYQKSLKFIEVCIAEVICS